MHAGGVGTRNRQPPRPRSGGQQQLVVPEIGSSESVTVCAVGSIDNASVLMRRSMWLSRYQSESCTVKSLERFLAGEKFLGQWRSLVGQILLVGDQHDLPVESFLAQCFGSLGSAESAADDDESLRVDHDHCSILFGLPCSCSTRKRLAGHPLTNVVVERRSHQRCGQARVGPRGEGTELFRSRRAIRAPWRRPWHVRRSTVVPMSTHLRLRAGRCRRQCRQWCHRFP